jgi:hypothetical protein
MNKDEKYNRSEKGKARCARYRIKHWMRLEDTRLAWNRQRRERSLNELHSEN